MFDIIGDIHGCAEELSQLLIKLVAKSGGEKSKVVFLGDLTDRGPHNLAVLQIVMKMVKDEKAYAVLGNHDDKLRRYLRDVVGGVEPRVKVSHGLEKTIEELKAAGRPTMERVYQFLSSLPMRLFLDNNNLLCVHASAPEKSHDWSEKKARAFSLYGVTTGKTLPNGFPERLDWAKEYDGKPTVVHGHVVDRNVKMKNNVWCIDTGCVFGGHLTALRYPSMEIVQVRAKRPYDVKKDICFD